MKKLMVALAVVAMAVAAQAYSFDSKTAKSNNVQAPSGQTLGAATAYLFESTKAEDIVKAWAAGETWTTGNLDSSSMTSAGKITAKTPTITYGSATLSAVFALQETIGGKDYYYLSTTASATAGSVGTQTLSFEEAGVSTTVKDLSKGYNGAGWYTAVPEPTSGLLLLLGMAGLALRRRRA